MICCTAMRILFSPALTLPQDENSSFRADGLEPCFWSNAQRIREVFRQAFVSPGLTYFNPHSFRDTLVQLGKRLCRTPEEFEAWSKNLGHEHMLTTFAAMAASTRTVRAN